jgi:hypothetical protein
MRLLYLCIFFPIFGFSQVVLNWNTNNVAIGTFVPTSSPNATVTISGASFNTLQGASPRYNTGGTANWGMNGLGLGVNFPNTSTTVVVDIVFSNPACGDLSFSIHDIDGSTSNLIFEDKVTIETWDQNNAVIPVNGTNFVFGSSPFCGGQLYYGNNNQLNTVIGRCQNGAYNANSYGSVAAAVPITLRSPSSKISRVRISYGCAKNAPDVNAYYSGTNPDFQNIVIGNFTLVPPVLTPPTISGTPTVCPGSPTTLTAGGYTSYSWNTGQSTAAINVSPTVATTYTVTGSTAAGCTASNSINVTIKPTPSITAGVSSNTICTGQSVNLSSGPTTTATTTTYNFEASNPFTLVNVGGIRWYHGSTARCNGTNGLYIGTASTNNNYATFQASVDFAYIDIPITECTATLSFNWRCAGKSTDNLSVWVVPTSTTLTAGTALNVAGNIIKVGGDYWNAGASCNTVTNINLIQGWVTQGQTIRLVFQARNASASSVVNVAPMIDDVVITQTPSYTYSWTSSASAFTSSSQNTSNAPTGSTTYTLTATSCNGCTSAVSALAVVVDPCPLPVELISFEGICTERKTNFNWSTGSEANNDYFTLEQSRDSENFYPIAQVDGAGSTSEIQHYLTTIANTNDDFEYYRLKQTDFDGTSVFSEVIYVACDEKGEKVNLYPNPASEEVTLSFNNMDEGTYVITFFDFLGKQIMLEQTQITNNTAVSLNVQDLSSGNYLVKIVHSDSGKVSPLIRFSKVD